LKLFFREIHGAEKGSIRVRRYFRFRRRRLGGFFRLLALRRAVTRLLAPGLVPLLGVVRLVMRRLLLALRLDAAERAAQFLDLAFIGDFLPLGNFNELEDFVHLVVQFFQRIGDEQSVFDSLADRRGRSGPEIGRLGPLTLSGRNAGWRRLCRTLGAAVFATLFTALFAAFLTTRFTRLFRGRRRRDFSCRSFGDGFRLVRFSGRRDFVRAEALGGFGMRFTETSRCLGLVLVMIRMRDGCGGFNRFSRRAGASCRIGGGFERFRRLGNVFGGGRFGSGRSGARTTTAAATTAAAAAALGGSTRRIQIRLFVRHKIPLKISP
jgi:hypothetical protein